MKIIGVEKGEEAWFLGIAEGVDPENLEGLKISGGAAGDRNITVGEKILEEIGVDPESMEWVSVEGGSDDRLSALIAGQLDVAVLQPRHILPLEAAGGADDLRGVQGGAPGGLGRHRGDHGGRARRRSAPTSRAESRPSSGSPRATTTPTTRTLRSRSPATAASSRPRATSTSGPSRWSTTGRSTAAPPRRPSTVERGHDRQRERARGTSTGASTSTSRCLTEVQEKLGLEPNPGDL